MPIHHRVLGRSRARRQTGFKQAGVNRRGNLETRNFESSFGYIEEEELELVTSNLPDETGTAVVHAPRNASIEYILGPWGLVDPLLKSISIQLQGYILIIVCQTSSPL